MTDQLEAGLPAIRERIDSIDTQLLALLSERARCALEVAEIKQAQGGDQPVQYSRPEREAQILRKVAADNPGPLDDVAVQRIYREVISACLSLEAPLRVAYLGPEGTYTHAATLRHFGSSVDAIAESGIGEIFHAVENGRAHYGVVPIENSTEGAINHTLDMLMDTRVFICGEVRQRIQHCLLSRAESLSAIQAVHAHPQSLAQCRHWLDEHLPGIERVSESSNAAAACVARENASIAAIAGEVAADLYNLERLMVGIEDEKNNTTRFIVIGPKPVPPSGDDMTTLLVSAPNRPGGLRRMLLPLEEAGVDMSRIESRPGRHGLWQYVFFIDVNGHQDDATLRPVLDKLADEAAFLRVLGSYPSAL